MNGSGVGVVRAIFWKECRENVHWALLGLIGLAIGLMASLHQAGPLFGYMVRTFEDYWPALNGSMAPGASLIAVGLGFLQILPERRRDQWAFLIHRPASRTQLFWGKAGAGLALYLMAAGVPFLGASFWAATPGNLAAPFDPHLMLAGLVTIVCSANLYFAALTVALRPARWYGSRILPLVPGGVLTYALLALITQWGPAIVLAPILTAMLALAAWSSFAPDTAAPRRPLAGRIALAVTLYAACAALCLAGVSLGIDCWKALHPDTPPARQDQYEVLDSGQIVRATYVPSARGARQLQLASVHDLSGRPLAVKEADLKESVSVSYGGNLSPLWSGTMSFMNPQRYLQPLTAVTRRVDPQEAWFYVAARRRIVLYSLTTHLAVREIGPSGMTAAFGSSSAFPGAPVNLGPGTQNTMIDGLYVFDRQIYRITAAPASNALDAPDRIDIAPVLKTPMPEKIVSVMVSPEAFPEAKQKIYVVSTLDGLSVFNAAGERVFVAPAEPARDIEMTVLPAANSGAPDRLPANRYVIWNWPAWVSDHAARTPVVTEYSASGQALSRTVFTAPGAAAGTPNAGALSCIAILPAIAGFFLRYPAIRADLPIALLSLTIAFAGLLWAMLCRRTLRRAALTERAGMAGAVVGFVFGLPALLTMLALYPWPALVICSNCGKKRAVTQDLCEHCGAAFLPAPRDGTEISEPAGLTLYTEAA